jgi:gliding motility-associated-like protein
MKKLLVIAAMFVGVSAFAQEVYIPNAFSPDGDGLNDYWKPVFNDTLKVDSYLLEVYTRNGDLVFETRDSNQFWDGTYWNSYVSESLYVYRMAMICNNIDMHKEGFIKVIR